MRSKLTLQTRFCRHYHLTRSLIFCYTIGSMAQGGDKTTTLWDDIPTLLTAAHELKAPLVLIRQLSFELDREADPEIARQIRLTAERSLRLVESLTKVARLEDTLFPIEPLDIGDIYRGVAEEM